jgi:hypothetical protein
MSDESSISNSTEIHEFNSRWLGFRFGFSQNESLLSLSEQELINALQGYKVTELRISTLNEPISIIAPSMVRHVDTQISYTVPTKSGTKLLADLGCEPTVQAFHLDQVDSTEWQSFDFERYRKLRGVTDKMLNERYVSWARNLTRSFPKLCGRVVVEGQVIGDFFAQDDNGQVKFSLAVGNVNSNKTATYLYAAALDYFNLAGFSRASSSFSASNIAALNTHAHLQCRFTKSTEIFFIEDVNRKNDNKT